MKKTWKIVLLLAAYCIPWAYFALHGDATGGTMLMYGIMLLAHASLCVLSIGAGAAWAAPAGCVLSGAVSCLCAGAGLQEMSYYFKPFTAVGLVLLISVVLLAAETAVTVVYHKRKKEKARKA